MDYKIISQYIYLYLWNQLINVQDIFDTQGESKVSVYL